MSILTMMINDDFDETLHTCSLDLPKNAILIKR